MLRRSPSSATSLHRKQEELSRRELELRDEVAKLERLIADAPRLAEETSRRQREELLRRATEGGRRLDASVALQDKRRDGLKYAEKLREFDVSHVEAAAHAVPIFNVFREDEPRDWLTAEEALSNAPRKANGLFIVTKVVE